MKKIVLILAPLLIVLSCENTTTKTSNKSQNEKSTFLTKYHGTTWTNGVSTYTFSMDYDEKVDVVLPICDTCILPSVECHMCGYSWMLNEIGKFSFGTNYQNDFFYEEDETQFFEDNSNTIYSKQIRGGFSETYESGKIIWIPAEEDSSTVLTIKRKNQPVLEAFQKRKTEEQKAIDDYIDENY